MKSSAGTVTTRRSVAASRAPAGAAGKNKVKATAKAANSLARKQAVGAKKPNVVKAKAASAPAPARRHANESKPEPRPVAAAAEQPKAERVVQAKSGARKVPEAAAAAIPAELRAAPDRPIHPPQAASAEQPPPAVVARAMPAEPQVAAAGAAPAEVAPAEAEEAMPATKAKPALAEPPPPPPSSGLAEPSAEPPVPEPAVPAQSTAPEAADPDDADGDDEEADEIVITPRLPAKPEVFAEGDHVVYPTHGVGKVERIAVEEIAGHRLELIHITFEENRMTLRVPVAKARSAGLRKLATRPLFDKAMEVLKGRARIKRAMWSRRAQEYEAKINSGDPLAIAEVVRDLHRNAGQPDQSFSERQIYEAAMDRLAAELAALDQTDKATAATKLQDFLKTG